MKNKNIIICTCFIFLLVQPYLSKSQSYYWSSGKKVNLKQDYSSYIIYCNDTLYDYKSKLTNVLSIKDTKNDKRLGNYSIIKHIDNGQKQFESISKSKALSKSYGLINENNDTIYLSNYLVMKLKNTRYIDSLNVILKKYDGYIYNTEYSYITIKIKDIENVIKCSNEIYESNISYWSHPDFLIKIKLTGWEQQYYLHNTSGGCNSYDKDIDAYEAWSITKGCSNIRVAVIDEGVEDHPDLVDENGVSRVLQGRTFSGSTSFGRPGVGDSHGEACAGIIAASHSDNYKGIAPNVKIVPVKIWDNASNNNVSISNIAAAINWAYSPSGGNADILSCSWYCTEADVITDAINNAQNYGRNGLGSIVCCASGNKGVGTVVFPSKAAISVGALDRYDDITPYSNTGSDLDIMAYGGIKDIRVIDRVGTQGYSNDNYYNEFDGTSAACPQVSGVSALILSVNPNLSRSQVENILFTTATDLGSSGRDNNFGYGKVNAFKGVQKAVESLGYSFNVSYFSAPTRIRQNQTIVFSGQPGCVISAGTYYNCDVYESLYTLRENTDWYWALNRGLSPANPNDGRDRINKVGNILKTYYYYVRYNSLGQTINKWVPIDPTIQDNRKILVNDYKEDLILSNSTSGDYGATNSITMQNNFEVPSNSNFSATIYAGENRISCPTTTTLTKSSIENEVSNNNNWDALIFASNNNIRIQIVGNKTISDDYDLSVFDNKDILVFKGKMNKIDNSFNNKFNSGIYKLKISNNKEVLIKSIIIN